VSLQASHGLQTRSAKRHEPHLSHNLPLLEENSGKKHPHIIAAEIDKACSEVPLIIEDEKQMAILETTHRDSCIRVIQLCGCRRAPGYSTVA
jgi:hypothetical protein